MCRTCHLFTDLQVATHIIRCSQPHMLSVLDSALAHARTLAHRIVNQDCHYAIETGTTRATLPNYGRIPGDGPVPVLDQRHANNDQMDSRHVYRPSGPHGKRGPGKITNQLRHYSIHTVVIRGPNQIQHDSNHTVISKESNYQRNQKFSHLQSLQSGIAKKDWECYRNGGPRY